MQGGAELECGKTGWEKHVGQWEKQEQWCTGEKRRAMPGEAGPQKDNSCEISVTVTYHTDRRPGAVGTVPARGKPSMVSYTKEFLHAHHLCPYGLLYHRTTD